MQEILNNLAHDGNLIEIFHQSFEDWQLALLWKDEDDNGEFQERLAELERDSYNLKYLISFIQE